MSNMVFFSYAQMTMKKYRAREREGHEDIVHRKSYLHNGKYIVRLCGTMSGNRELDR